MIHVLKISASRCDAIASKACRFDIRPNDRKYRVGDYVEYEPVDPQGRSVGHEIRNYRYRISYVLSGCEGLGDNYIIIGFD